MMVSTLRPPARKKKSRDDLNGNKGKKRKAPPPSSAVAALYTEDIGMAGVKQPSGSSGTSSGPILKGPEGQKFQITETAEEKLRRLRRKARFDAQGGPKKKTPKTRTASLTSIGSLSSLSSDFGKATKKKPPSEPDFLSRALSSGRKDEGNRSSSKDEGNRSSSNNRTKKKKKTSGSGNSNSNNHKQLVGTCQDLEKPYLRLTTYPKPENIRPLPVLVKSLGHIKNKYYQEEDFMWANEQLKSVRQDITVQRLRGRFVLDVYETHARILLEHGDLAEFNQCQTMIRYLTTTGVEHEGPPQDSSAVMGYGDNDDDENDVLEQTEEAADEFRAYHVLYALVQNSCDDLTKGMVRVRDLIQEKGDTCNKTASGRHALEVVKSVTHNDYRAFFKLYANAPHMSAYLMDFLVKRMRESAYERITAAYRPTICVEFFRGALYFSDMEETRLFLRQMGAKFVKGEPPLWVDCKASASKK